MSSSSSSKSKSKARMKASVSSVMSVNAVYFPSYKMYEGYTPATVNIGCVNIIYYAFASINPSDGVVFLSDEWIDARAEVDGAQGGIGSFINIKEKNPHLRVLLSIGGGNTSELFPIIANDGVLRDNFARSATGLIQASGLDGLDIMWEFPADPQQGLDFLSLLATIRIHLSDEQYILTAALPANITQCLCNIDLRRTADYIDFLNLMAYDFTGPWSHRTGHHAQLYAMSKEEQSAAGAVQYVMSRGCPPSKIVVGIPVYGRSFLHATGPGQKFRGVGGQEGTFEYTQLPRRHAKEGVDKRAVAAVCVGGDGGWVTYDNPETVRAKAGFCRQKGLGGLFYWHFAMDDRARSLIAAGFKALHSSS